MGEEECKEKKYERNIKILIYVILYLLLALAFISPYDMEVRKAEKALIIPSNFILQIFLWGLLSLIFLIVAYCSKKKIIYKLLIAPIILFFLMFFLFLFNTLSQSLINESILRDPSKFLREIFGSGVIVSSLIVFGVLMIVFILQIIKNKNLKKYFIKD